MFKYLSAFTCLCLLACTPKTQDSWHITNGAANVSNHLCIEPSTTLAAEDPTVMLYKIYRESQIKLELTKYPDQTKFYFVTITEYNGDIHAITYSSSLARCHANMQISLDFIAKTEAPAEKQSQ